MELACFKEKGINPFLFIRDMVKVCGDDDDYIYYREKFTTIYKDIVGEEYYNLEPIAWCYISDLRYEGLACLRDALLTVKDGLLLIKDTKNVRDTCDILSTILMDDYFMMYKSLGGDMDKNTKWAGWVGWVELYFRMKSLAQFKIRALSTEDKQLDLVYDALNLIDNCDSIFGEYTLYDVVEKLIEYDGRKAAFIFRSYVSTGNVDVEANVLQLLTYSKKGGFYLQELLLSCGKNSLYPTLEAYLRWFYYTGDNPLNDFSDKLDELIFYINYWNENIEKIEYIGSSFEDIKIKIDVDRLTRDVYNSASF